MAAPISGATGTRFPAVAAPAVPAAQPEAVRAPDTVNVPDVVEDRRADANGNIVARYYSRGRLLGKVSFIAEYLCDNEWKTVSCCFFGICQLVDLCFADQRLCFFFWFPHHPLLHHGLQGGFAKCFKFTMQGRNKIVAGKVVDKESLHKARAKSKVSYCFLFSFCSLFPRVLRGSPNEQFFSFSIVSCAVINASYKTAFTHYLTPRSSITSYCYLRIFLTCHTASCGNQDSSQFATSFCCRI